MKVAVLEWNKETGSNTVREFAERFGDNSVLFVECDVSKQVDLKSMSYNVNHINKKRYILITSITIYRYLLYVNFQVCT